jgi:DNA-binding MurR/RpiR family transcriptional regulator
VSVSEATVVRFAQRIGYEGFTELKSDLMDWARRRVAAPAPDSAVLDAFDRAKDDDTLSAVAQLELNNVVHLTGNLDRAAFGSAAGALLKADHVYTFGLGISAHLAGMLTYLLVQTGLRSTRLSADFSSPLEQLVTLRPTDLLVVLSFPPYSRKTLEMVQDVAGRGIPTLGICDRAAAPLATVARTTLAVKSDNLMFTNAIAATSVLLNALITEVAQRNREQSQEAVSRISQVLEDDDGVIK